MFSLRRKKQIALAAGLLALVSGTAQAEIVMLMGAQGPKEDLNSIQPPTLASAISDKQTAFNGQMVSLGGTEFEGAPVGNPALPPKDFTYNGGAGQATFSGGGAVKDGGTANPSLGRYNMTPGVVDSFGDPAAGHWLEANSSFSLAFSQAISAFSFFVVDLGDYDGTLTLELLNGNSVVFSQQLVNNISTTRNGVQRSDGNGNLTYVGLTSNDPQVSFTSARFNIAQCTPGNVGCNPSIDDYLGFDSFVVGNYRAPIAGTPMPEPASLALVGLGLMAAGWSRKAKRSA